MNEAAQQITDRTLQKLFAAGSLLRPEMTRLTVSASIAFVIMLLAWLFALAPQLGNVVSVWDEFRTYSHGYLVPLIAAYLVYRDRNHLLTATPRPSWLGPVLLVATAILYLIATTLDVTIVQMASLPLMVFAIVLCSFGATVARRFWFPLIFLYFAIPVWNLLSPGLQALTVEATRGLLTAARIPAYIEGNFITLPNGRFEIEGGCSGTNYFIIATLMTSLLGYTRFQKGWQRLLVLGIGIATALIANYTRVFIIILAGYLTDMQHFLVTVDHYWFGWVWFGILMVPVFILVNYLESIWSGDDKLAGADEHTQGASTMAHTSRTGAKKLTGTSIAGILAILMVPAAIGKISNETAVVGVDFASLNTVGEWRQTDEAPAWRPDYQNPTHQLAAVFDAESELPVELTVLDYQNQRHAAELVSIDNRIADNTVWIISKQSQSRLVTDTGKKFKTVRTVLSGPGGTQRVVHHWFVVSGVTTTSKHYAKLLQLRKFIMRSDQALLFAASTECNGKCDNEDQVLGRFIAALDSKSDTLLVN